MPIVTRYGGSLAEHLQRHEFQRDDLPTCLQTTNHLAARHCTPNSPHLQSVRTHRNQLQEDMHFRLMRLIEQKPQISQREIADHLGVSLGGINFCIKALIEKGYVKVSNFTENPHKLGYAYLLTPSGIGAKAAITGQFLKRKLAEYESLKAEIESLQSVTPEAALQPSDHPVQQSSQP